ncbi:HD-GYP domain-containing protein, partial [Methylobacterium trifolii]
AIGDLAAGAAPPVPVHKAVEARAFLNRLFKAGEPVTAAAIEAGAEIIDRAIHETGIRDWLEMVWRFDDATHQHCLLVAGLAAAFGRNLGLRPQDCHRLTKGALLHDIGKTRIPVAILNKPARLDEAELRVMRTHPVIGYEMLLGGGFDDLMLSVVRSHHELLDGSGYPDGLKGSQIPDLVRLVTICDIYAALIERRPYKAPMSMDRAYAILVEMGPKLDADLVCAFRPVTAVFDAPAAMAASA